jgi:hypothetical protein
MSSMGLDQSIGIGNSYNERIQAVNRGIEAQNALKLKNYNDLINNVNGTKIALNSDLTTSREKEGIEGAGLIGDVSHVQNTIRSNLKAGKTILGKVKTAGAKLQEASNKLGKVATDANIPQGDSVATSMSKAVGNLAGKPTGRDLPSLDFFNQSDERPFRQSPDENLGDFELEGASNANPLTMNSGIRPGSSVARFGEVNEIPSGAVDLTANQVRGAERLGVRATTSGIERATGLSLEQVRKAGEGRRVVGPEQIAQGRPAPTQYNVPESAKGVEPSSVNATARANLLSQGEAPPSIMGNLPGKEDEVRPIEPVGDAIKGPSVSEAPSAGAPLENAGAMGAGAGEVSNLGKLMSAGGKALKVANVIGGAIDIGEDIKHKGIAGDNAFDKVSNVAGAISGTAEAIGGVASGLEAVGTGLDLTGGGAVLGVPLQILGAGAGAVGLIGGVIGDIMDNNKDRSAKKSAQQALAKAGPPPKMGAPGAYQSLSLGGSYAGVTDSNNKIQGTGAF